MRASPFESTSSLIAVALRSTSWDALALDASAARTPTTIMTRDALFTSYPSIAAGRPTHRLSAPEAPGYVTRPSVTRPRGHSRYGLGPVNRRESLESAGTLAAVFVAGLCNYAGAGHVVTFVISAIALAALARLVGTATEQLGAKLGSGGASVVQSALGNLPELFIAIFALRQGLVGVVQAALVGSILANSVLVLGLAFIVGGLRNGPQRFDSGQARMVSTLTLLAAATMAIPSLAHAFHTPAEPHGHALSLVCAGVLLAVFVLTLPAFLRVGAEEHPPARWSTLLTGAVLVGAGVAAAFTSDWFV